MKRSEKVVIFIILSFFGKITECKNSKAMERLERNRAISKKYYRPYDNEGNALCNLFLLPELRALTKGRMSYHIVEAVSYTHLTLPTILLV